MGNINADKLKAIESAMGQIEKQFGKGSIMKLGEHSILDMEAISTGSLDLDIALGIGEYLKVELLKFMDLKVQVKLQLRYI